MTAILVCGGTLTAAFLQNFVNQRKDAAVYAVDGGLAVAEEAGIIPDYLVGDFDTAEKSLVERYEKQCITIRHQPEKDATDTELAVDEAISNGADMIFLLGAIGSRMDHTMANIHMLYHVMKQGKTAVIVNENNRLTLYNAPFRKRREDFFGTYLSFLPFSGEVTDVVLSGVKYPLFGRTLTAGSSLGVSNEVTGDMVTVSFSKGYLLMIEAKD